MTRKQTKNRFLNFLSLFGNAAQLRAEKARLEAFLSAVPGEYCGWANDGSLVYSQGFCDMLALPKIKSFVDIQNKLSSDDSATFEGAFNRLKHDGAPFTITVQNRLKTKMLKLAGTRGSDLSGADRFYILWLEEIADQKSASDTPKKKQDFLNHDLDSLQDSLDALPHPVWIRDQEQKIIWCNVAYAKMVALPPSKIIAQQKEIISPSRKRKPGERNILFGHDLARAALDKGCTQTIKLHEVVGGSRLLIKISEIPLKAKQMTIGMAEDFTEEERILGEVKNNQSAHRALLEQLRSSIAIYDANQQLDFYNSSFAQLWGLEDGWLNTRPKLGDIMEKLRDARRLPEQADFRAFKKIWLDMFTGLIEPHDDMLYLPDGAALRMLVVPHKLGGLMMTFEDVTSRLELESSYNTLIAVQKETLDNLEESVVVFGSDGRLKLWNPAFGRLWGLDPETLEGEPHISGIVEKAAPFFDKEEWPEMRERFISLALDRSVNTGRLDRVDGTCIDYSTVPLPDGGVLITCTNITDTVRVENALREKNAALEAAEQLKHDFLANVSYQLRTPLSAIMGFNEMLSQEFFGPLNKKQKEYTADIQSASDHLLNLINDILDLSTIEAGQMDLNIESASIKDMMENIMDLIQDWARKEKIEVSLRCPANIGKAEIDVSRVKQAIINIVRNAISSIGSSGGAIDLHVARRSDDIKIEIKDNGIGIAPEDQRRILEPFERIEGQQTERGAGLGLSLVKNIMAMHHGRLDLSSVPGVGTTVSLIFPKKYSAVPR